MKRTTKINLTLMSLAFILGAGVTIILLREPTEPLTAEVLQAARQRWREAGVSDYDLHYRMHGSVYEVKVQGGIVTEATVNGQVPQTADLSAYGVEGLFDLLELELDNRQRPNGPFAGRAEAVVMRVRFDPQFGYIERYLRSAGGYGQSVAIELINFVRIE